MTNNLDATVFVFRHKNGSIVATYLDQAKAHEQNPKFDHLATLEPRTWIQSHYDEIERMEVTTTQAHAVMEVLQEQEPFHQAASEPDMEIYRAIAENYAQPTPPSVPDRWQPIETAPKDTFVLLLGPSGYTTTPFVCTTGRMCSDYHAGRWIDHANDNLMDWGFAPTHWMPLPAAPKPEDAA